MIIPHQQLSPEALHNLIEQFVLREGTDYGENEKSLQSKVDEVRLQIEKGEAVIVYSEQYETVDIRPKKEFTNAD